MSSDMRSVSDPKPSAHTANGEYNCHVVTHQRIVDGTGLWRRYRLSADAVRTSGRCMSQWLLPGRATAATTAHQIHDIWCRENVGPAAYFLSPGLLQLTFQRHIRWIDDPAAVCPLQNAAARLLSDARRYDHITSVLHKLHWLPVRKRVNFKIATLVYRSLSGMAPAHVAADC